MLLNMLIKQVTIPASKQIFTVRKYYGNHNTYNNFIYK